MDDLALGTRNAKGDWTPERPASYPEVFVWPPKPSGIGRWLVGFPGYLWPWNALYLAVTAVVWWVATPALDRMASWSVGWIAAILVRNYVLTLGWFGLFHWMLYRRRSQDQRFKYAGRWPGRSDAFTFGTQLRDNMFWSLASGVPIWTAWEAVTWWLMANHHVPVISFRDHPVWFVVLFLLVPMYRDIHFYLIHRLIHWPPLYKAVHSLHHRNTNPGPWSGLSMHPVEHLLYFSAVAIHWIVPSHPAHALFDLVHLGLAPAPGHTGYERIELGGRAFVETGGYAHYLHHKFFEVNYADGTIPLDRWFGTFHDGTPESAERMKARKRARAAARRAALVNGES